MDLQSLLIEAGLLVLLLALNGFFVSIEFAIVSVPRPRIEQLAIQGNRSALLVQKLLTDPDRVLAASQLGITMASLGLGFIGDNISEKIIAPLFEQLPVPLSVTVTHAVGFAFAFLLITSFHIVLGEQAPKMAALRYPDTISLLTARPIRLFDLVFRPFIALLDRATEMVLKLIHIPTEGTHKIIYTADELKLMVTASTAGGELEEVESQIVHRAVEFADREVVEVMIPRTDIVAIEDTATVDDFLKLFEEISHSRFPVYSGNLDDIVGFVWVKDILRALAHDPDAREQNIKSLTRNALFVPSTKHIGELFAEMQRQRIQLAIVIDEYGGTAGMVTIEEMIEEVVGRVGDELTSTTPPLRRVDEARTEADALLRIEEVNAQLGLDLPESDDYETLAGLILTKLGRVPKEGDSIQVGEIKLTVTAMAGPRIEKILLEKISKIPKAAETKGA